MKKFVVSIDESSEGKYGLLSEVKKDGTIYVMADRWEPIQHVNPNCKDASRCNPHSEFGPVTYRTKTKKPTRSKSTAIEMSRL